MVLLQLTNDNDNDDDDDDDDYDYDDDDDINDDIDDDDINDDDDDDNDEVVRTFNDDIHMESEHDKCAETVLKKGKSVNLQNLILNFSREIMLQVFNIK